MKIRLAEIRDAFLDLLFPPKCPFCRAVLTRPGICDDCAADLPWFEDGFRVIRGLYCAAPLRYDGVVRETLLQLKFRGRAGAAQGLGQLLTVCAAERLSGMFDAVTYAPISRERRRERGYNQSELLAEAACRAWGTRPERLLVKIAYNPPQSGVPDDFRTPRPAHRRHPHKRRDALRVRGGPARQRRGGGVRAHGGGDRTRTGGKSGKASPCGAWTLSQGLNCLLPPLPRPDGYPPPLCGGGLWQRDSAKIRRIFNGKCLQFWLFCAY